MKPLNPAWPRLLLLPLLCAAFTARPALADEGEVPPSELPPSDSPESTASVRVLRPQWQGARRKIQTFLVPLDEKARAPTARVAQALEGFQGGLPQYEVVDLGRALKVDSTPEQAEHAADGRKLLAEGNLLFAGRGYADAALKYRAAIKELERGLAAIEAREYAEAWARLGAVEALAGDDKAARVAFLNAARHDPERKLQGRAIDAAADTRLQGARADIEALPNGTVEFESKPVGARVIIDGEARGQAPLRLELPAGRHLVRFERAGLFPSVELLEVPGSKESTHSVTLRATPRAADLYEVMAGAADEAGRAEVGANTVRLAEKFGLDRMFVGSVSSHGTKVSLTLALVDVQKHRQIGKSASLLAADGTDADQIEDETRQAAKKLSLQDTGDGTALAPEAARAAGPQAAGDGTGRAVATPVDELGLATKERKPIATETASAQPAPEPRDDKKDQPKGKVKKLKDVNGTEDWK